MQNQQYGQAMLDFVITATFLLIPLLFIVTYLGKIGDVQHRTYEGARYMAWEKAISNKSNQQIENEMNKRILFGEHVGFDSERDRLSSTNDSEKVDTLYRHTNDNGDYENLLVSTNKSLLQASSQNKKPGSSSHSARRVNGYDLSDLGMLTATVSHEIDATRHLPLPHAVKPSAKNVIYIESWRQTSKSEIVDSVEGAVFGSDFYDNPLFSLVSDVADFIGFEEFDEFEPGYVKPDVVPCSRVIGGGDDHEKSCF